MMRKLMLCMVGVMGMIVLAAATAAPVKAAETKLPPGTLEAEAVRELFSDRTVESVTASKGRKSLTYYSPEGLVRQNRNSKLRLGEWWVRPDGRMCMQMEGLPAKCRIIVKEGDEYKKYIVRKNGEHQHTVTYIRFLEGNPEGI